MASYVLTNARLWVAQFDLSGDLNAIALASGADAKDATTFGVGSRVRRGGIKTVDLQCEGYYQAGTDLVDDVLFARIGTPTLPVACAPTGGADGEPAYLFLAELARYQLGGSVGEMFPFSVEAESQGAPLVKGLVGLNGVKTIDGAGVGRQLGLVGAGQKLYAGLHVLAGSGGTFTGQILSGTSGGIGNLRFTFAGKTGPGFEWASIAGPIATDDHWAFTWTVTAGSFTVVGVFGIF
jgi:hypothetical protein